MMKLVYARKILVCLLSCTLLLGSVTLPGGALPPDTSAGDGSWVSEFGVEEGSLSLACKSAVLMEANTGKILYAQNMEAALPPASVTKIMTLLLLMEAIDDGMLHLEDTVTVSQYAASMGGSQVFLKEGEKMPLEELLKCVVIASANDAAVALAEHLAGSVSAFVARMNQRAAELGMTETHFENVTGLDDAVELHLTSALDIARMSRELIRHRTVLKYSSLWMDSIRDGAFGLTNTNRLVRFYDGCTGLKTGSTSKAGFCISATAERDGTSLICVIMGAESRDSRNAAATSLLDWGFANYGVYHGEAGEGRAIRVEGGTVDLCPTAYGEISILLPKRQLASVRAVEEQSERLVAPVKVGDAVGRRVYYVGEETVGESSILATQSVGRIGFFEIFGRIFRHFLLI